MCKPRTSLLTRVSSTYVQAFTQPPITLPSSIYKPPSKLLFLPRFAVPCANLHPSFSPLPFLCSMYDLYPSFSPVCISVPYSNLHPSFSPLPYFSVPCANLYPYSHPYLVSLFLFTHILPPTSFLCTILHTFTQIFSPLPCFSAPRSRGT